jgi:hypothetical protein
VRIHNHIQQRAADSLEDPYVRRIIERDPHLSVVRINHHDPPSGASDAQHFSQGGFRMLQMLKDTLSAHGIERARREW